MLAVFYIFAALLIIQGILSLLEGVRFLAYVRREVNSPDGSFTPRVTIIAPCKDLDPAFEQNLAALFKQDYPDYEIIFVIASSGDPALPVIKKVMTDNPARPARLVVAGEARGRSEKVNNLLAAVLDARAESEVYATVDSDARVHPRWLRSLVAPLSCETVGASTGYRWYLPEDSSEQARRSSGFWPALLSAWNGSIATGLGPHRRNFAWGGSTAILKSNFERFKIADRWRHALSDDYALTTGVQSAGKYIRFVPNCLLVSREDMGPAALLEFTTRQIIITRVYNPKLWWTGMISQTLFCSVFFGGLAAAVARTAIGHDSLPLWLMLAVIYVLGSAKGWLRLAGAREALRSVRSEIDRLRWMFILLWPVVAALFLYNFARSATTRVIRWRGTRYEMRSPTETIVIAKE